MRRLSSLAFVLTDEFEKRNNDEKYFNLRGLDPSLVGPIVRKAPAAGLQVMAHVESAHDFSVAVQTGVDQVVHMPGFWPDETLM